MIETNMLTAPIEGIQELSRDEIELVDGGARGDGAAIIGNLVGGALGIVGGIAVTAVAGPFAGAAAGVFFAGVGSVAATNAANQVARRYRVIQDDV